MPDIALGALALLILVALAIVAFKVVALGRALETLPAAQAAALEQKHRAMLTDLHEGLARQGERLAAALADSSERLRAQVAGELRATREAMQALALSQERTLGDTREAMLRQMAELSAALQARLAEQGRADQELVQATLRHASTQLATSAESLTKTVDGRLEQISGKVAERLDQGFQKTNETFASVMVRLATIDEAQKKIDGLTTNVVGLQELLGDKRSRGAFGEVQLEALVRNILPPGAYEFQYTLASRARADCVLRLPEPTGLVAVDSKFPLENYQRMFSPELPETERDGARRLFKADVKRHVDDIASKYIVPGETSDGAVMFVPAEAVFAEIHGNHGDLVDYAMQKRVWIVSPTTLMAVLNTARAVLKDVETRRQVHIIKEALARLAKDFGLFDRRMKSLADHIQLAQKDVEEVHVSSRRITQRFEQIEAVELDGHEAQAPRLLEEREA